MERILSVRKINQMASGASYVVVYDARITFLSSPKVCVSIEATDPADSDPTSVEAARTSILAGAEHILLTLGRGADIVVQKLIIHPSDFHPLRFKQFTAQAVQELIEI